MLGEGCSFVDLRSPRFLHTPVALSAVLMLEAWSKESSASERPLYVQEVTRNNMRVRSSY
jgi:hypothetical protein